MSGSVEQAQFVSDLPDTEAHVFGIGLDVPIGEGQMQRVKVWLAIAVGPPEARMLYRQLGELRWRQRHRTLAGSDGYLFRQSCAAERSLQGSSGRRRREIFQGDGNLDVGAVCIGQGQGRNYLCVADFYGACRCQSHRLPDAGVAIADGGDPVPTFGGDERWAIEAHDSDVFSRSALDGLFLRNSWMRRRRDADGQDIRMVGFQDVAYIEDAANESSLDRADRLSVEPDCCCVVDAFEGESEPAFAGLFWQTELDAVPVVLLVQGFRDGKII